MEGENLRNDQEIKADNPFDRLRGLRNDWSDEVPKEILHGGGTDKPPKFKVRRNWWNPVFLTLMIIMEANLLQDDLKKEVEGFIKEYGEKIRKNPTTAEDITKANSIIDKVLDSQR
jgi:hypothetical protein